MKAFAALIDALVYTTGRNAKLALIGDYLRAAPDPDRGWALAALTGAVDFPAVKSAMVKALVATRVDEELVRLSRQFAGDTAETAALLWPDHGAAQAGPPLRMADAVAALQQTPRAQAPAMLASLLDRLDADERHALLKLAMGGLRVGVSAQLARRAFADAFGVDADQVAEYWHAIPPPYAPLFAWAEGRAAPPDLSAMPFFRPFMLAHPLDDDARPDMADHVAEWKWDGIRVQLVRAGGAVRLFSRGGEDIGAAFPDILGAASGIAQDLAVDGELLVRGGVDAAGGAASFNALQQRLGRKSVPRAMLADYPAFVRLYDLIALDGADWRGQPWQARRAALEGLMPALPADRFDLSPIIDAPDFAALAGLRDGARDADIEGVMIKRRDAPYVAGRRAGLWYKWKRDALTADCVMMYAQRGNGRRASFYSDYTFGCWDDAGQLLPVGKAYSGFTDDELKWLDRFVRQHSIARYGPVREVEKTLVLEIAFDSIHHSKRHKSGLAMRFPRIVRIRTDKPAAEADRIATLQNWVK